MTSLEKPTAHKVLLVDDDNAVREMMTATLEHKGFEVVAAANVSEALRFIYYTEFRRAHH
jgi:CheY-like chemotaxis protein